MLEVRNVSKRLGTGPGSVQALDDVSLTLSPGDRHALVGPSGSGKSTLGRVMAFLERPDRGEVWLDGERVTGWRMRTPREMRRRVQMIWQSPRLASDPRLRVREIILEPARAFGLVKGRDAEEELLDTWTERLGIPNELLVRFPQEVSDGQLQRACLARSLAVEPTYLICDEISSMLDVSTQAALLEVIADVQRERNIGVLLITHDHLLADSWCRARTELLAGRVQRQAETEAVPVA